jgi:hypothetical protein
MARRESDDRNEIKIHDNLSNSDVVLYDRMPTTTERQNYHNASVVRKNNKVELRTAQARQDAGMKILTGFKTGSFERKVEGEYEEFSSVEGAANYFPEWRKWIEKNAADLVMLLAARVFDAPSALADGDQEEEDEGEEIEGK